MLVKPARNTEGGRVGLDMLVKPVSFKEAGLHVAGVNNGLYIKVHEGWSHCFASISRLWLSHRRCP